LAAAFVLAALEVRRGDAPSLGRVNLWVSARINQLGWKERKWEVQQVERLKCEPTLGGPGNKSEDTVRSGKWWEEGFPQGFRWSLARQAASQEGTGNESLKSKAKGLLQRPSRARGVLFTDLL